MSISVSGWASLSFISGRRLCPPASTFASGPNLVSRFSACSRLAAFSYSTYAGTCNAASPGPPSCPVQFTRRRGDGPVCVIIGRVMTLTQLNAFVLVARLGSVTAAANALGVSEPAVSQALSALRAHLGDQLLSRGPSGMTLTAGGSRLLATASQIVVLGAEAHAAVRAAQCSSEQLRMVATATVAEFVTTRLIEAFTKRFAGSVEVSCGVAVTKEMPVLVANRLADVAVSSRAAADPGLPVVSEPIFKYRLVAVTAGNSRPNGNPRQWRWLVDPSATDPGSDVAQFLAALRIPDTAMGAGLAQPAPGGRQ